MNLNGVIRMLWYNNEDDFRQKFKYMMPEELASHYNASTSNVNTLIAKLKLRMKDVVNNLTDYEVIEMYKSLLFGVRKSFPNGFFSSSKYVRPIIRYLINE